MRLHMLSLAALAAALAAPAMAQTAAPIHIAGELTTSDSRGEEQHRYDDIRVHLEAGQRYRLSVDSEAFDPVAHLYRPGNVFTDESQVAMNDDSDGLNSRISYTPTESGDTELHILTNLSTEQATAFSSNPNALIEPSARAGLPAEILGVLQQAMAGAEGQHADPETEDSSRGTSGTAQ